MSDYELNFQRDSDDRLSALLRDLNQAHQHNQLVIDDEGRMLIPSAKVNVGGIYHTAIRRHELVQRAIDDHDPEQEAWAREQVRLSGMLANHRGFFRTMESVEPNLLPTVGLNYLLNVLLHNSTTKIATWYYGPFVSDWTPTATANANWAGAGSGPLATELAAAQFDEGSTRQSATFVNVAASGEISTSSARTLTLSTGVTGLTLYGATLNQSSTIAYNNTDTVLLSATRFATAKSGLGATDQIMLSYEITATSS